MTEKNNLDGWRLVPIEPTKEMWAAVNKLDDQMAAGSYDGKGCSIEQAWNCMLAAAPSASAQPAPAVCDGKEQDAFEAWAKVERMDMSQHPLHYLFLNSRTDAARQGWKGAIEYCATAYAAPAQSASPAALTDEAVGQVLRSYVAHMTAAKVECIAHDLRLLAASPAEQVEDAREGGAA